MSERNYFVLCEDNCRFEAMSKEQILTAIEQAVSTGEIKDVDSGFVTRIKELNTGSALSFWIGTNAEYLAQKDTLPKNTFVIISDDTSKDTLLNAINGILEGNTIVPKAAHATNADYAERADKAIMVMGSYSYQSLARRENNGVFKGLDVVKWTGTSGNPEGIIELKTYIGGGGGTTDLYDDANHQCKITIDESFVGKRIRIRFGDKTGYFEKFAEVVLKQAEPSAGLTTYITADNSITISGEAMYQRKLLVGIDGEDATGKTLVIKEEINAYDLTNNFAGLSSGFEYVYIIYGVYEVLD